MAQNPQRPPSMGYLVPPQRQYGRFSSATGLGERFGGPGYRRFDDMAEETSLGRIPSVILPTLQFNEKRFFELVHSGDVRAVEDFLADNPDFNINCVNFQGVSGLHIAVKINSEAMVEFLLTQKDIDIGDCVLHAVRDNKSKILEMLLEKQNAIAPGLEYVGVTHSSDFPDHVTPLILAAQCGHYEIIEMLINRGHIITKPHNPSCRCGDCRSRLENDDVLHAETLRLNLYRAISNPAYICHSSNDPILTAFHLCKELKECADLIPEFRAAYRELAAEISTFAVELIACCRSTEETELILKQQAGIETASHFTFPRLVLAMDCKQKEFVAHPNTQQILEAEWHGDWHEWVLKPVIFKMLYSLTRIILLPLLTLMCVIMPKHSMVKHSRIPLNKLMVHNVMYVAFLIIIFMQSNIDKTGQKRAPPESGLEPIIMIFVLGYIWGYFRICAIRGPARHFRGLWSWHDLIMYILFLLTFLFWAASYMDVKNNDQMDLERKYWHQLDPILISEGTFAIATIMAFFRLMYLCRLNYYLGPLQIGLGKMGADMAQFISIFAIIIISFTAGLCRFYQYYDGMVQTDTASGMKTQQVSSFVDFKSTLKTFFWAIFCMSSVESADVVIENLPGDSDNSTIINKHDFTATVGYIAFALFEVLIVIMILNMLVATMCNTFQRVIDNVDIEWTFGKTDVYLEYMVQTTLPPPLNLIPTADGISSMMEWLQLGKDPTGKSALCSMTHCCYISTPEDEQVSKDFPVLMSQLVQRYFREKDSGEGSADMDAIKQDLSEIKELLKEALK